MHGLVYLFQYTHSIETENKVVEHNGNEEIDVDFLVSSKGLQEL